MPQNSELLEPYMALLEPVNNFLGCATPDSWLSEAVKSDSLPKLLIDHLHCELKAAQSASLLLRRYVCDEADKKKVLSWLEPYENLVYREFRNGGWQVANKTRVPRLKVPAANDWQAQMIDRMVLLMKEELHHFEQVLEVMESRNIPIQPITASRYAAGMIRHARTSEPGTLVDKLIIGAFIEARSCERFAMLAPHLDYDIAKFYVSLLRSEARHFEDYLALAEKIEGASVSQRVDYFRDIERELIQKPDTELRFHSGPVA